MLWFIHDRKTGKPNTLYLKPVQTELLLYRQWLLDHRLASEWLFPSIQHPKRHITEKQFYKIMSKVGDLLGINYLGTHTMRKTGAPLPVIFQIFIGSFSLQNR